VLLFCQYPFSQSLESKQIETQTLEGQTLISWTIEINFYPFYNLYDDQKIANQVHFNFYIFWRRLSQCEIAPIKKFNIEF
jgi:hypothetical protein